MKKNDANDGAWFAPKQFGYGASLPIAWQGWAMLAVHVGVILAGVRALHGHPAALCIWVAVLALVPMPIYAAKTRGGWRWRWGRRD